ncbi:heat shock protease protein [Halosimplex carlsbadense 2-9-1]|uniref:Heat shock protease protein n=1 Tax=Halosimplex carlsbadense 2-9-1 TaxID=797114 RepID=M0CT94_9EURY|nr:Hsp20/alpha crystallin family protein [Halosimplex carlsbadense]ELZ25622.1 heat shock protease protein [Halosimplex carlsbadense 2-9-1]
MTHHPDHEVELFKDEGAYQVYVDLPGYDRDDVDLRWHDGRLHVTAEHRTGAGETRVFNRHVSVPRRIDADAISATFGEDVLTVRLPVAEGGSRPGTRIEVGE